MWKTATIGNENILLLKSYHLLGRIRNFKAPYSDVRKPISNAKTFSIGKNRYAKTDPDKKIPAPLIISPNPLSSHKSVIIFPHLRQ